MTPPQLVRRLRQERQALAALWRPLTAEQLTRRPGPQPDWSVKDLIAHLVWWEAFSLERVGSLLNGVPSEPAADDAGLNQRAFEQSQDRSLAEVLAAFEAAGRQLETLIASLTDEQLNVPAYYPTYDGIALLPFLLAGTLNHYPGHAADLRAYTDRLAAQAEIPDQAP